MITVSATVVRGGVAVEVPLAGVVPGDVVHLADRDSTPAHVRLLSCKDLFLIQANLTGESSPVEKFAAREDGKGRSPLELTNVCYLDTSVESGTATAVVVATGLTTFLGGVSASLVEAQGPISFDRGVARFTWLMIGFITVLAPLVFVINGVTRGDWAGAFCFAMAVAAGTTSEMLPMVEAVCLSKAVLAMARQKVIVKRLTAIQNLSVLDVLCTDKTGTLNQDRVVLEKSCDVAPDRDDSVLELAFTNRYVRTGSKNLMHRAVPAHPTASSSATKWVR